MAGEPMESNQFDTARLLENPETTKPFSLGEDVIPLLEKMRQNATEDESRVRLTSELALQLADYLDINKDVANLSELTYKVRMLGKLIGQTCRHYKDRALIGEQTIWFGSLEAVHNDPTDSKKGIKGESFVPSAEMMDKLPDAILADDMLSMKIYNALQEGIIGGLMEDFNSDCDNLWEGSAAK